MSTTTRGEPGTAASVFVAAILWITGFGTFGGGVWGFVRGLGHLPTLPFAVLEGALLLGIPSLVVGLVVGGVGALIVTRAGGDR
ncbi:hypothetical protein [Jatrophihabitans endophyticus]|uniref:hypothetical protein n=1 Tax=Jatrophihabitans endophyticus TaxID=1206085 RepID=UPI0019E44E2B|nr:hypothetical protein [Jatrophihabitans endophyticus]MBE7188985.1 hypothetical protein [Jatrophihabitans endophyticus]